MDLDVADAGIFQAGLIAAGFRVKQQDKQLFIYDKYGQYLATHANGKFQMQVGYGESEKAKADMLTNQFKEAYSIGNVKYSGLEYGWGVEETEDEFGNKQFIMTKESF